MVAQSGQCWFQGWARRQVNYEDEWKHDLFVWYFIPAFDLVNLNMTNLYIEKGLDMVGDGVDDENHRTTAGLWMGELFNLQ